MDDLFLMERVAWNCQIGWIGFLFGVLSGAFIGLNFHKEDWQGGYGSFARRLLRLGHIACFGMGLMNILFALSLQVLPMGESAARVASIAWVVALLAMPLCCWLAAWRKCCRHLFPVPVAATLVALISMFIGWGGL